jgi:glycosyltransferase involved in cell wall biosynthesis
VSSGKPPLDDAEAPVTPMHRVRLTHVLEATAGGTRRHLRELLDVLPTSQFALRVVCAIGRDPGMLDDVRAFRTRGIDFVLLPMRRGPHPTDASAVRALRRLLIERPTDILHLHSTKAGLIGRIAAFDLPCRVIYSPHGLATLIPGLLGRAALAVERLLAARTDAFVAVSRAEARVAVQSGLCPSAALRVLPNTIDLRGVTSPSKPSESSHSFRFGFVGELRPQKNPLLFLAAARLVLDQGISARFVLPTQGASLGDVVARTERLRLASHVEFVDTSKDLNAVYERSDVAVLPSLWEGMPYALLDALARKLPTITSDLPVFQETLGESGSECLAETGNALSLADRMCRLSQSGEQGLDALAERQARSLAMFPTPDEWGTAYRDLYAQFAPSRAAGPAEETGSVVQEGSLAPRLSHDHVEGNQGSGNQHCGERAQVDEGRLQGCDRRSVE